MFWQVIFPFLAWLLTNLVPPLSVDWVIPEVLCVKQGGWGGRARYILKDAIKFVPLYGWVLGEVRGGGGREGGLKAC